MQAKLETQDAKHRYARRKRTVEPVFGFIKAALRFTRPTAAASPTSPPRRP
jgi:hypothetical protein